ncbi:MAG TPA: hypothetical protein PLA39_02160 [Methanoculleus sp.]|nr:hypothetical protein [Methanoculleus sp.]
MRRGEAAEAAAIPGMTPAAITPRCRSQALLAAGITLLPTRVRR